MKQKLARVVAIHDMSGYGKCSLTVAIPVISAAGIEVCPLPTALLSTNTLIPGFKFFDFTPQMDEFINHWKEIGFKTDCAYSGFLGSAEQIQIVKNFMLDFNCPLKIVDPVMGDNGIIIKTYTPEMCSTMRELVAIADIVTPNLTEAYILTGRDYVDGEIDSNTSRELCAQIIELGAKNVVLTGVVRGNTLYNCAMGSDNSYFEVAVDLLPYHMHGTGDLFTSVLTAGIVSSYSLKESVESAAHFVRDAMIVSNDIEDAFERGVTYEPIVYKLRGGLYHKD
jgi:pyridoxine kinase